MKWRLSILVAAASFLLAAATCPGRCLAAPSVTQGGHCHGGAGHAAPASPGNCPLLRTVEVQAPASDWAGPALALTTFATVPMPAGLRVSLTDPVRTHGEAPPERLWLRRHALLV